MQSVKRTKPNPGVLNGIKLVLASGAIAGAVGIWSALSGSAVNNAPAQIQNPNTNELVNLPTLVPLVMNPTSNLNADQTEVVLRNVTAPEPSVVIQTPVVQSIVIGGTSGGGSPKPAARTRSSR